jgi:hypothetical protein
MTAPEARGGRGFTLARTALALALGAGMVCAATSSSEPAPDVTRAATAITKVVSLAPMTRTVSCDPAYQPPGLRVIYGPGGGETECFGGTGPESIGQWVQGIATTGHSGEVFVQHPDSCVGIPFGPNDFLRLDEVVCVLDIDTEH